MSADQDSHGEALYLQMVLREWDAQMASIDTLRTKARSYLAPAGIAITFASGVLAFGSDPPKESVAAAIVGLVLFFVIAALVAAADLAITIPSSPSLEELRELVESEEWSDDAVAYWIGHEFSRIRTTAKSERSTESVDEPAGFPGILTQTRPILRALARLTNAELLLFVFEIGIVSGALMLAV